MIGEIGELGPCQLHKFVRISSKWMVLGDGWPECQQEGPSAERRENNGLYETVEASILLRFLPPLPPTSR